MIGDSDKPVDDDDIDDIEDADDGDGDGDVAEAISDGDISVDFDETIGDLSAELNVEELVAKIESTDAHSAAERARIRKRLEEIREAKESALDDTYNFSLDDD
tara:strand:+ start:31685 stop:31993 length:309 start_codon:yes stop_codon:yes gene_type:complete